MDFLEGIENRYFTTFFSKRRESKIKRAVELKPKAINQPEQLTWEEIRVFMRALKFTKSLKTNSSVLLAQEEFYSNVTLGIIPALFVSLTPLLVKETYRLSTFKKFGLFGGIFLICYTGIVYPSLNELKEQNRKIVHEEAVDFTGETKDNA